ncbi:MAG: ABC transporter ATP-binding protein [Cyanobacteria bacterium J06560_5]
MTVAVSNQQIENAVPKNDVVLSLNGVSKKFCRDFKRSLLYGMQDISQEVLAIRNDKNNNLRRQEFWALQDVSFDLHRGDALGLIGKNGSGKSTLLRIIAGLIKPDVGSVEVYGRVAPLIALGAGFNPVLTGRENIYANMSILGLKRTEIDERFEEVVEFAELANAIDSPVRSYSSGMAARLGFSCAVHTSSEILLIDEVLSVGDIRFRAKCSRRLARLRDQGASFILVSHNSQSILSICEKAIYLQYGKVLGKGSAEQVIENYESNLFASDLNASIDSKLKLKPKAESESTGLDITEVFFVDSSSKIVDFIETGKPISLTVTVNARNQYDDIFIRFIIREISGEGDIALTISNQSDDRPFQIPIGKSELSIQMPYVGLKPALYTAKIIIKQGNMNVLDGVESFKFHVKGGGSMSNCQFYQPRDWNSKYIAQKS